MALVWFLQEMLVLFTYYNLENIPSIEAHVQEDAFIVNEFSDNRKDSLFDKQINGYMSHVVEQGLNRPALTPNSLSKSYYGDEDNLQSTRHKSVSRLRKRTVSSSLKIAETWELGKGLFLLIFISNLR